MKLLEVLPAADSEKMRFYLAGMYLHDDGGKLIAVATNGTALLRIGIPAARFSDDNRCIVPARTAAILVRLLSETRPSRVTLRRSRVAFAVNWPGVEIVSGLIDAKFPDYQHVVPHASSHIVVRCGRAELIASVNRLNAVATGEAPLLALSWTNGGSLLRLFLARQPEDGGDIISAEATGDAKIAVALSRFAALLGEFQDADIMIEAADRGVLMREGSKLAVLSTCIWNFDANGTGKRTAPAPQGREAEEVK